MYKESVISTILLFSLFMMQCRIEAMSSSDETNRLQEFQKFLKLNGRDENNNNNNNNNSNKINHNKHADSASGDFVDRLNQQRFRSGSNQLLDDEQLVKLRELIETLLEVQCAELNMTIKLHYDSSYSKLTSGFVQALAHDGQLYVTDKRSLCVGRTDEQNGELVLTFEYDDSCSIAKRASSNYSSIFTTKVSVEFSNATSNIHLRDFREDYVVSCIYPTNLKEIEVEHNLKLSEQKNDENHWTYPQKVTKGDNVFVQGSIQLFGDYSSSSLHSFPVNCWLAQTSNNVNDQFRHYFLNQGCPVNDHRGKGLSRVYHLANGQTKVSFSLTNSLLWSDPIQTVFVHCQMLACVQNFTNGILGVPKCPPTTYCAGLPHLSHALPEYLRHVKLYSATAGPLNVLEKKQESYVPPGDVPKPVNFDLKCQLECGQIFSTQQQQQQQTESVQQPVTVYVEGVGIKTVVAIAFASFFIGMLMMAALWFVHVRTDPKRKLAKYNRANASAANSNMSNGCNTNNNNSLHMRHFEDANLQQTAKLMLNPL